MSLGTLLVANFGSDVFTLAEMKRAVQQLREANANPNVEGDYIARVHPRNVGAIIKLRMAENTAARWRRQGAL